MIRHPRHDPADADDPPPSFTPNVKLQRWIDLLASLLARSRSATFDELAKDVSEYATAQAAIDRESDERRRQTLRDSLKRTFERDKDDLRAFGVPIESATDEDGNPSGAYRLRRTDFYLPYLCLAVPGGGVRTPRKVDRWGYEALKSLAFEPDELQVVVDAAACVRSLGDPLLAADAESALRKLAADLPVDAAPVSPDEPRVLLPRARADAAVFEALGDALARRKLVTFAYHAMSTDRTEPREVEPYGLFFLSGHWYLAARDRARGELRNFRLNRIARPAVNDKRPQSPDYELPADFRLREHARSRHPWELGDGDPMQAVVAFTGASGPTVAAMRLGSDAPGDGARRAFQVRRPDAFVRWLLSFAGEAVPVSPPELVERFRDEARRARDVYPAAGERAPAVAAPRIAYVPGGAAAASARARARRQPKPWQPKGAAAQFRRLLYVVPQSADGEEHPIADVAARAGSDVATLRRDLYSLVTRYDTPAAFVEAVQLFVESDRVSTSSHHLARPMRLTTSELCALELGLAVLRARRPPDEHALLDQARVRLRAVIAKLPADPIPDGLHGASLGEHGSTALLASVRTALRERRRLRLAYRKSGSAAAGERVVCPYALVASSGMLYVIAHCEEGAGIRVFRMDRVEDAEALAETFEPRDDFPLDAVLRQGKPFIHAEPEVLRVQYSPRIARWIAEREGRALDADGGLVAEHPLADYEWGMRHVLQYGAEAEVLEPAALRDALRARLERIVARLIGAAQE